MAHEGRPIDLLTVADKLRAQGRLDEIGGTLALDQLVDSTPTAAHAEYYIDIVRQKHLLRLIIERARQAVDRCYDSEEDADEILGRVENDFFEITGQQRSAVIPWPELIKGTVAHIEHIYQTKMGTTGLPTGFKDLDRLLLGLQPTNMIIIAARPGMGKTSLALTIAENIALGVTDHTPRPVAGFSLEMSAEELVRRMICSRARVSSGMLAGGYITNVNHGLLIQAADALTKAKIYLDDTAGLEILELRSRARRLKRKYDIQLIVVDYLQLLNYSQFNREGRQRETSAISAALKGMAKELKIPVIVLSQLNRSPETRDKTSAKPKLSDLRDSGSIEQDADVVGLLRRPSMYPDDKEYDDKRLAIFEIAKNRNGKTDEIRLNFEAEFTRFEDRTEVGTDHAAPEASGE